MKKFICVLCVMLLCVGCAAPGQTTPAPVETARVTPSLTPTPSPTLEPTPSPTPEPSWAFSDLPFNVTWEEFAEQYSEVLTDEYWDYVPENPDEDDGENWNRYIYAKYLPDELMNAAGLRDEIKNCALTVCVRGGLIQLYSLDIIPVDELLSSDYSFFQRVTAAMKNLYGEAYYGKIGWYDPMYKFVENGLSKTYAEDMVYVERTWKYQDKEVFVTRDVNLGDYVNLGLSRSELFESRKITPPYDIDATAKEIYGIYKENPFNGDLVFKDKRVLLSGKVQEIRSDMFANTPVVALDVGDDWEIESIQCRFPGDAVGDIATLKKGDSVMIVGTCTGMPTAFINLEKCVLVK